RMKLTPVATEAALARRLGHAVEYMFAEELGRGVDALELRYGVEVLILERVEHRLEHLVRTPDIDHDAVLVEPLREKCHAHHESRAVQPLRRPKHRAAERMSDHDLIGDFDGVHETLAVVL